MIYNIATRIYNKWHTRSNVWPILYPIWYLLSNLYHISYVTCTTYNISYLYHRLHDTPHVIPYITCIHYITHIIYFYVLYIYKLYRARFPRYNTHCIIYYITYTIIYILCSIYYSTYKVQYMTHLLYNI